MGSTLHLPMNVFPFLTENQKSSRLFLKLSASISSLGILSKPSPQNADVATPAFVALCLDLSAPSVALLCKSVCPRSLCALEGQRQGLTQVHIPCAQQSGYVFTSGALVLTLAHQKHLLGLLKH